MGRDLGIIILGTVILILMGTVLRGFFANADVHLGARVGVAVIGGGILYLIVRLIRARVSRAKTGAPREAEK